MFDQPFAERVALLVLLLGAVSSIEGLVRGKDAQRWRYSLFVLGSGCIVAVFGLLHDAVTVAISPEYFAVLKRLGWESVGSKALLLGGQAGFSGGVVGGMLVSYLAESRRAEDEVPRFRALFGSLPTILWVAAGSACLTGALTYFTATEVWVRSVTTSVDPETGRRLITVSSAHLGTYLGAAGGLGLWWWRRRR